MSVDGFIALPEDDVGPLFDWYGTGPVPVAMPSSLMTLHVSAASAGHLREGFGRLRALVAGRHWFDLAGGWGGRHPMDVPVFVVTHSVPEEWVAAHPTAPFTFVLDGVAPAVARASAVAGDGLVGVGGSSIIRQCLAGDLLDEIVINLVPVLLGDGVRMFDRLHAPLRLDGPRVVEGAGVTHLYYRRNRSKP